MTTEISHARIGAFKAIGQSFGASFRHWRWLSLTVLFALLLGWIAALPIVRQLKASLGFNPSAASTDLGDRIQAWVESMRAFAGNTEGVSQFVLGLLSCAIVAWLLKIWLASGLVGSVRGGRGLGYRELIRVANAGFWAQLKQSLIFILVLIVLALPAYFTFKWSSGVGKVAVTAEQTAHAASIVNWVVAVTVLLFLLWFDLARAALSNMSDAKPRVRGTVMKGLKTLFKRPFASIFGFVLFLLLGLGALALISAPLMGIRNAWIALVVVALATAVGGLFRVMRLETLARISR